MKSTNQNDIVRDYRAGVTEGRFKWCTHISISPPTDFNPYFRTSCLKQSFDYPRKPYSSERDHDKPSCPTDCHFFIDRAKVEAKATADALAKKTAEEKQQAEVKRKERIKWWLDLLAAPFKWFDKQEGYIKILILLIIISLLVPRLVQPLKELIEAARGK